MFNPRKTSVLRVSSEQPETAAIDEAAALLRRGSLVAFPTETVYGLGANALDAKAVESIFTAKGRPSNNPVIVHVADATAAQRLTTVWPGLAAMLAERFWPGSLTLILPKRPEVPDIVTAGGPTVGLRVPAHPVALALLRAAEIPIAAPSANRSTEISPTTARHVLQGLDGRIDMVLDAGPTPGGLESTVLDLTTNPPRILRPGLVSVEQLRAVIGDVAVDEHSDVPPKNQPLRSPGMMHRHYAPRAELICLDVADVSAVEKLRSANRRIGWLRLRSGDEKSHSDSGLIVIDMPLEATAYAAKLYAALHELDDAEVDCIVVDLPPQGDAWLAVHDRLRRAAQKGRV